MTLEREIRAMKAACTMFPGAQAILLTESNLGCRQTALSDLPGIQISPVWRWLLRL